VQTARDLIDAGADAIVGHHPHVIQKIDYYKHKPIFYSLGNFVFDQLQPETRSGIVVGFDIGPTGLQPTVKPYFIDEGAPVSSVTEDELTMKKVMDASGNVEFRKGQDGWAIVEKSKTADQLKVDDRKVFTSQKITDNYFKGLVSLEGLNYSRGYRISIISDDKSLSNELHVPYPIYRFETGDVNRDGKTDILLGVIKSTHFDLNEKRRLFVLRIDSGRLRPLWLGSRVCQELIDFNPIGHGGSTSIITLEQAFNKSFCNGLYEWDDFGLSLVKYEKEGLSYDLAHDYFSTQRPQK